MKKPSSALFERMKKDAGRGLSDKPSDNASVLKLKDDEWPWIDALHQIDERQNPKPLIRLLGERRVPSQVMPYLADWLDIKLGRHKTRARTPDYVQPKKPLILDLANRRVSALVRQGLSVKTAIADVVRQWAPLGVEKEALADFRTGKSGNARRQRAALTGRKRK